MERRTGEHGIVEGLHGMLLTEMLIGTISGMTQRTGLDGIRHVPTGLSVFE
jgi:hypothetical protein